MSYAEQQSIRPGTVLDTRYGRLIVIRVIEHGVWVLNPRHAHLDIGLIGNRELLEYQVHLHG